MAQLTAHYEIAGQHFEVEVDDFPEMIEVRRLVGEFQAAVRRLKEISGSDYARWFYKEDVPTGDGNKTFTLMKVQSTDRKRGIQYSFVVYPGGDNPLGVYPKNWRYPTAYEFETEERFWVDEDGGIYRQDPNEQDDPTPNDHLDGKSGAARPAPNQKGGGKGTERSQRQPSGQRGQRQDQGQRETGLELTDHDRHLRKTAKQKINQDRGDEAIGENLAKVLWNTMQRHGLTGQEYNALCEKFRVDSLKNLPYAKVEDAYGQVARMVNFKGDDLPT